MNQIILTAERAGDTYLSQAEVASVEASAGVQLRKGNAFWLVTALLVSQLGLWLASITPASLTLALLLERIDPVNKATNLSFVLGTGAFVLTLGALTWGGVSDMTTSRFGRRRPYLLGGTLVGVLAIWAIPYFQSIVAITAAWCLAQFAFKAPVIIMFTSVSEFVPKHLQSRVSAAIGLIFGATTLVGTAIVRLVHDDTIWMFIAPTGLAILAVPVLAYLIPDRPANAEEIAEVRRSSLIGRFWINPIKRPDFGWLVLNRFLVYMGLAFFMAYQVFFLRDHLQQPQANISGLIMRASSLSVAMVLCTAPLIGWISDRLDRRKIFVIISGVATAIGMLILSQAHDLTSYYVGSVTISFGMGVYYGTDLSLAARVLSRSHEVGRGMALLSLTGTISQSIAPALAPVILSIGVAQGAAGNYTLLFIVAGSFALAGAFIVQLIRCTR